MTNRTLRRELLDARIIVILRGLREKSAIATAERIVGAGASFLEIPLNTEKGMSVLRLLADHFRGSHVRIGAGTVLSPSDVENAADAGAEYLLSPNVNPSVIRRTLELGLLSIPGFQTPTEAFLAMEAGATVLKAFPCSSPENISVLKSVIKVPVFAVGGISHENRDAYLKTADGIGVGTGIFHPDWPLEKIGELSRTFFNLD